MDAVTSPHPSEQVLQSYGLGRLEAAQAEVVDQHLEECADCRQKVAEMTSDSFLMRLRDAQAGCDRPASEDSDPEGTQSFTPVGSSDSPSTAEAFPAGLADHPDYEIKQELGRGGMGVVYLAHNKLMGRDEVLKVMGSEIVQRPGVLDRFLREIRAVARLRHPNIVTAYSAIRLDDNIIFAMEYVEGLDLAKLVKLKGPLPVAHACHFVYQAALGLQHAHEEGLIHRDIKPGNLMLSRKGDRATIKVLDFGLAKATREEKIDSGLTHEGQTLGTPDYMAPEQILDAPSADIRADIYSLGGTLYYLLSGRPPFQVSSHYDLYQAHISRDADPLNLVRPEVPSELAALVAKMMAKDPARRFQTPAEVAQALTPFFKKGGGGSQGSHPDSGSQAGSKDARSGRAATGSPPTQPATGVVAPPAAPGRQTEAELDWQSLIQLRETGPSKKAPKTAPASPRRPGWVVPSVGVGVLLLAFLVAWAAGLIRVKTREGTIVLEDVPEQAQVFVDGERITVEWPEGGGPLEISAPAGKHGVEVKKDGFRTFGDEVTVENGGRAPIRVRLVANEAPTPRPVETIEGPLDSLFNGKDLTGWDGDHDIWSVEDGAITARNPKGIREQALIWSGGNLKDFELRVKARSEEGHPAIYYRSPGLPDDGQVTAGYKFDIVPDATLLGMLYEDVGQGILAHHGEKVRHGPSRGERYINKLSEPFAVELDQWNEYTIIAQGNHLIHKVNGRTVVDYEDLRTSENKSEGLLILWAGYASQKVQFKDVQFRVISPANASDGTGGIASTRATPQPTARPVSSVGFLPIFNGKDLEDWAGAVGDFEVEDGLVRCKVGRRGTMYYRNKEFSDFVARVEFRLAPGANDGLAIRYPGEGDPAYSGMCEIQILDDSAPQYAGSDPRQFHGSAYGMVAARRGHLRPVGEWNHQEVTVRGSRIQVVLNGATILDADLSQVNEFKDNRPHPGKDRTSGYFGLTGFGPPAEYRLIEIKDLRESSATPVAIGVPISNFDVGMRLVKGLAILPDGHLFLAGGFSKLGLWDLDDGHSIRPFIGHAEPVFCVALSPDGRYALSGSGGGAIKEGDDKTARLWEIETGRELGRFNGHRGTVTSVAFSPYGRTVLTGSFDKTVRLWDATTFQEIHRLEGHSYGVECVAFLPDGKRALSGGPDGVRLWNLKEGKELRLYHPHISSSVLSIAVSHDGRSALTGSADKTACLWEIADGHGVMRFEGHDSQVNCVAFSPDEAWVLTGSGATYRNTKDGSTVIEEDSSVRLWDVETGRELACFRGHSNKVNAVAFTPDATRAVSGSEDGTVCVWRLPASALPAGQPFPALEHTARVNTVAFDPKGRLIASGSNDGTVKLWDAATGKEQKMLKHLHEVGGVAFSHDGKRLASWSQSGLAAGREVKFWDVESGSEVKPFGTPAAMVGPVVFSPDEKTVATVSPDGSVQLWDLTTGKETQTLRGATAEIESLAFSRDGSTLVAGDKETKIHRWNMADGTTGPTLDAGMEGDAIRGVHTLAFTPDDRSLLSGGPYLALWDRSTDEPVWDEREQNGVRKHVWGNFCVDISPDGNLIASAGLMNDPVHAFVTDLKTGATVQKLRAEDGAMAVAFSPDGRRLATAGPDHKVRL